MKRTALSLILMSGLLFGACSEDSSYLTMNGEACTSNDECASGNCYEGKVCRAPNWGGSGGTTTPSTGKIVNGEACKSNDECASGNCYEGKICRTKNWGGASKLEIGDVCTKSDQCSSNNCVEGVCNAAGDNVAKTKNGAACTANDQCASGNCYEGKICRSKTWNGSSKLENGYACTVNSHCISNNCANKVCSAPVETKTPNGDSCKASSECASNYCHDGKYCMDKPNGSGSGGAVTTSDAIRKYCTAYSNDCALTKAYRNYDGCMETLAMLRQVEPKCTSQWDAVYVCMSASTCSDIASYSTPFQNFVAPAFHVPDTCVSLASAFDECREDF